MKKSIIAPVLALILTSLFSCQKDSKSNGLQDPSSISSFDQIKAPASFDWQSAASGTFEVDFLIPNELDLNLAGSFLMIKDANQELVLKEPIINGKAKFHLTLAPDFTGFSYELSATGDTWPLESLSNTTLSITNPLDSALRNSTAGKTARRGKASLNPPGTNMLGNADFEINDFIGNNGSDYSPNAVTVDDGKWYMVDNDWTWATENASKVIKAAPGRWTWTHQVHSVTAGDSAYFTTDFFGDVAAFLLYYNANNSIVGYNILYLDNGVTEFRGVVPNNASFVSVLLNFRDNEWVDNAYFSTYQAVTDRDNDGVADDNDDFPNDPNLAYRSAWPSSGKASVLFEDLWPSKGDYDFNDMVISSEIILKKGPNGNWVSADFEIALDAVGAGIANGLAIRLVDLNKNSIGNFISSVTGSAVLDPDVDNGIIVFNNPSELRSSYYTNTRPNQTAKPDTAKFTVNFSQNNGTDFIPDFYIFRSDDRSHEIHVAGYAPTSMANPNTFDTKDDVDNNYLSSEGLPWGMIVVWNNGPFQHALEKVDFLTAYPSFASFVVSGGLNNTDWYQNPTAGQTMDLSGL